MSVAAIIMNIDSRFANHLQYFSLSNDLGANLARAVTELFENSLDAGANRLEVSLDPLPNDTCTCTCACTCTPSVTHVLIKQPSRPNYTRISCAENTLQSLHMILNQFRFLHVLAAFTAASYGSHGCDGCARTAARLLASLASHV